jgi:hypothetical protein
MKISADGSRIIFATGGEDKKIFTINADGTGLTQIYNFQTTGHTPHVDISANGERVIWCDWVGEGEIFISNADGSALEKIVSTLPNPVSFLSDMKPWIQFPPRLTANASHVYFIHNHADPYATGVWRVKSNGTELTQVFDYVTLAQEVFDRDVSEHTWLRFDSGFDISADGYTIIFGTDNFKLEKGILDVGDAVVYYGSTFYHFGEYAGGRQSFATYKDGGHFIIFRREYNDTLEHDEINVYFDTPGTGDPVKVIGGLDIFGFPIATQMAGGGSRAIVLGANGHLPITLVDRISASRLDLVSIDYISIYALGGFRFSHSSMPSITWNGDRFCFLSSGTPPQIWVADIGSDAVLTQPSITEVSFEPDYVLLDGSTKSTFKAHVMSPPYDIHTVTFDTFKDGAYHFRAITSDWPYWGMLLDNGEFGDAQAGDGYFCNNSIRRDLPETPADNYTIRLAAVNSTLRQVTMVDAEPFSILDQPSSTEETSTIPKNYSLGQNYPNPFNPSTVIRYGVPERAFINLTIYNLLGQKVTTLVNEEHEAQYYETTFDASHLPSGVYIYRLQAGEYVESKKLLLLK